VIGGALLDAKVELTNLGRRLFPIANRIVYIANRSKTERNEYDPPERARESQVIIATACFLILNLT
jgi:hypothetical protein